MEHTIYTKLQEVAKRQLGQTPEEKEKSPVWVYEIENTNHFLVFIVPPHGKTAYTSYFANGSRRIDFPAGFSVVCAVDNFFRFVKPTEYGGRKYRLYTRSKKYNTVSKTLDIVDAVEQAFTYDEREAMQRRLPHFVFYGAELTKLDTLEHKPIKTRRKSVYKSKIGGINDTIAILQSKVERMEKMIETLYKATTGEDYEAPEVAEEIDDLL